MNKRFLGKPPISIIKFLQRKQNDSFYLQSNEDENNIYLFKVGNPTSINLVYKKNDSEWLQYEVKDYNERVKIQCNKNDRIYFKSNGTSTFSSSDTDYYVFRADKTYSAYGNIQYLIDSTGKSINVPNYCFYNLFYHSLQLMHAPDLIGKVLNTACYCGMFGNTGLKAVPKIDAEFYGEECCCAMFVGCVNIEIDDVKTIGKPWKIPDDATFEDTWNFEMFAGTGRKEIEPIPGVTYYIESDPE